MPIRLSDLPPAARKLVEGQIPPKKQRKSAQQSEHSFVKSKVKPARPMTAGEAALELSLRLRGLPLGVAEYEFAPGRRYRFDRAWPAWKVAAEVEGGTRGKSRHTSHDGYTEDARKYNLAASLGWSVFRFTTEMVTSGEAVEVLERVLRERGLI